MRFGTTLVLLIGLALTESSTVQRFRRKQDNAHYKSLWAAGSRRSLAKTLWQAHTDQLANIEENRVESQKADQDSFMGQATDDPSAGSTTEEPELDYTIDSGGVDNVSYETTTESNTSEDVDVVTSISVRQTHVDSSISVESEKMDTLKVTPTSATIAGPTVQSDSENELEITENVVTPTYSTTPDNTTDTTTAASDNSTDKSLLDLETEDEGTLIFYLGEDTPDHLEQLVQDNVIQVIAQSVGKDLPGYSRPTIEVEGSDTDFSRVEGSGGDPLPAPRYISVHF